MALLWCDGFDHYGSIGNMTEGAWAEVSTGTNRWELSTANPRTGTHAMRRQISTATRQVLRRVLGGAKTTVGAGCAVYLSNLPIANNKYVLFDYRDTANGIQVSVVVQSTGIIEVLRGSMAATVVSLGATASPVVTAETYQHVEALVFFSQTVGTVEVRVNGVTVLSITGADTVATANVECSQVAFLCAANDTSNADHGVISDLDDVFCYDDTGSFNNTFVGDRRVLTLFPDADTAQADWTVVGAANGFDAINQANPDDDTTYISAGVPGSPTEVSEFGVEDLPAGISAVSAVVLVNRSRKTEAGTANVQMSVISGAAESAGTDHPMTEVYTYRQDVFETDPDSAAPFTPSEVDAIVIKADRTA